MFAGQCEAMTDRLPDHPAGTPTGLDDPHYAAFAWARFRAIMAWMVLAAAICVAGVIAGMAHLQGPLHLVTMLAVIGGVGSDRGGEDVVHPAPDVVPGTPSFQ